MSWWVDFRFAARALVRRPGVSLLVVLTMAIGIGLSVGLFVYLSYFTLPTLEAPQPDRLMWLRGDAVELRNFSPADWRAVEERSAELFSRTASFTLFGTTLRRDGETVHAWGTAVSAEYFEMFGAAPAQGRLLEPGDQAPDAPAVVVLNHFYWRRYFRSDPEIVGRTILLGGDKPYVVVGVATPGFQGSGVATGLYVPMARIADVFVGFDPEDRNRSTTVALARLRQGVSSVAVNAWLSQIAASLDEAFPLREPRRFGGELVTKPDWSTQSGEPIVVAARLMMVGVLLLLLLACANVANLLLAQLTARRRELGMHAALGAGRGRLAGRLLVESLMLSISGGLGGLLVANAVVGGVERLLRETTPIGMGDWGTGTTLVVNHWWVSVFFVLVTGFTGLLFGMAPAFSVVRRPLLASIRADATSDGLGRRLGAREVMLSVQVALAVVLLGGAGLLGRTLLEAQGLQLGFEPRQLFLVAVRVPQEMPSAETMELYRSVAEEVRRLPEVSAAGWSRNAPLSFATSGVASAVVDDVGVDTLQVGPGYFSALGISLLRGEDFAMRRVDTSEPIDPDRPRGLVARRRSVVLNEFAARELFREEAAVGAELRFRNADRRLPEEDEIFHVAGVVSDSRYTASTRPVGPLVYFDYRDERIPRMTLLVRGKSALLLEVGRLLRTRFPDLAVMDLVPFSEQQRRALADQRMNALLSSLLGGLGLLLAMLGIFSSLSLLVSARRKEIGLRLAVGAQRRQIVGWLFGRVTRWLMLGWLVGLAGTFVMARWLSSLLFGVPPHDPATALLVSLALMVAAALACFIPARRATAVDPVRSLRL